MNQFEYVVKLEEMKHLKTKKAKAEFIRNIPVKRYGDGTVYDVKILIEAYKFFKDTSVVGVRGLPNRINNIFNWAEYSEDELNKIGDIPVFPITATNDYRAFMNSGGIPAYFKVAVLKAQLEAGVVH